MGFIRCGQPQAVFSVGGVYFQAERSPAKVSFHYSVNGEMRLRSRGTAMLRGPHGSCPLPPPSPRRATVARCGHRQPQPVSTAAGFTIFIFAFQFAGAVVVLGSHLVGFNVAREPALAGGKTEILCYFPSCHSNRQQTRQWDAAQSHQSVPVLVAVLHAWSRCGARGGSAWGRPRVQPRCPPRGVFALLGATLGISLGFP